MDINVIIYDNSIGEWYKVLEEQGLSNILFL